MVAVHLYSTVHIRACVHQQMAEHVAAILYMQLLQDRKTGVTRKYNIWTLLTTEIPCLG